MKDTAVMVRVSAWGDVIMSEPFLWALKEKGYKNILVQAGQTAPVFYNHPFAKLIDDYNALTEPFDLFILTGTCETNFQEIFLGRKAPIAIPDSYADWHGLKLPENHRIPQIYLTKKELQRGREILGEGKWAVFYPAYPGGALSRPFWPYKDWEPILQFVKDKGYKICWIGDNRGDVKCPKNNIVDLPLVGKTTVREWFAIQALADIYIGNEGSPMILAQVFNKDGCATINRIVTAKLLMSSYKFGVVEQIQGEDINTKEIIEILEKRIRPTIKFF